MTHTVHRSWLAGERNDNPKRDTYPIYSKSLKSLKLIKQKNPNSCLGRGTYDARRGPWVPFYKCN